MTREQQRKLKELKQALPRIIQEEIKPYKLRKKSFMVWDAREDMFCSAHIYVGQNGDDGDCFCDVKECIKPLWMDDLLWDIIEMPENKSQPLSLRSIGAFTVCGAEYCHDVIALQRLPETECGELREAVARHAAHFHETVQTVSVSDYISRLDPAGYQGDLQELLMLIHEDRYKDALTYLSTMEHDWFGNHGMMFRQLAERYCKRRI